MRNLFVLLLGLATFGPAAADLLGSAVSVQGVLSVNAEPADGVFDLRITPYPDRLVGTALAPPEELDNVLIVRGAFTTKVDFGRTLFLGDAIFFEIAIRAGNSSGAYEVLNPRQELTAAPYALKPAAASVTDLELATDAVGSTQIADGSVLAAELGDNAVSSIKIADGAVATPKLQDGAVTSPKLGAGAVTTAKLGDAAVTGIKLGNASVDANKLADGSVLTARLADNAVSNAKLAPNAVDSGRIADGSVAAIDLAAGVVGPPAWNLAGNAASAGQFLGTTNALPLDLRADVGVTINGARFNNSTELTVRGSPGPVEPNADLALWPRGGTAFFNLGAVGTDPGSSHLGISAVGTTPFTGYLQRLRLGYDGSLFVGATPSTPTAGSFLFTDGSSATAFNNSATNQFMVRAASGVGINRTPQSSATELTVGPDTAGGSIDVVIGASGTAHSAVNLTLGTAGTDTSFRIRTDDSGSGNAFLDIVNRNSATVETPILQLISDGTQFRRYLSLFRGDASGTYFLPQHPIHVGISSIPNSGNGAHLTFGGVWTNGSSRTFKRDFLPVNADAVLERLLAMPVQQWRYKGAETGLHIGPVAEDFKAAFGLGGDERYIGTVDADGVALAAIKGLNQKLERENAALREALASLVMRLDALEATPDAFP